MRELPCANASQGFVGAQTYMYFLSRKHAPLVCIQTCIPSALLVDTPYHRQTTDKYSENTTHPPLKGNPALEGGEQSTALKGGFDGRRLLSRAPTDRTTTSTQTNLTTLRDILNNKARETSLRHRQALTYPQPQSPIDPTLIRQDQQPIDRRPGSKAHPLQFARSLVTHSHHTTSSLPSPCA